MQSDVQFVHDEQINLIVLEKSFCAFPSGFRHSFVVSGMPAESGSDLLKVQQRMIQRCKKTLFSRFKTPFDKLEKYHFPAPAERTDRDPERTCRFSFPIACDIQKNSGISIFFLQHKRLQGGRNGKMEGTGNADF